MLGMDIKLIKRKYVDELVFMRAIAAFGIFVIHATGEFALYSDLNSKAQYLGTFLNQLFRFGTPVFLMISGFVLFYNYRNISEFNIKAFLRKKFTYIIIPYIMWSLIYFLYKAWIGTASINHSSVIVFLKLLILGDSFAHLYFIFLIVQFYLLFPILLKYLNNYMHKKPITLALITFLLQALFLVYQYYFKGTNASWFINLINSYFWKTVLGWFFYFIFGGIVAFHYDSVLAFIEKHRRIIILGYITSVIMFLGEAFLYISVYYGRESYVNLGSIRPTNLVYSIFSFFFLIYLTRKIKDFNRNHIKILKSFGTYSLGIYFSHPLILERLKIELLKYFPKFFGYSRVSSILILLVLGWISTLLLCYVISLFNFRWIFLGRVPSMYRFKTKNSGTAISSSNHVA